MYTKEQLKEATRKLPKSLQMAIAMFNTAKIVESIGEQFQLHVDQVGKLSDEIRDTLFALHNTADFRQNVINSLQISPEIADQIVTRVNNEIFLKIRAMEKEEAARADTENEDEIGEVSPTQSRSEATNLFEEKMGKVFNLPSEKADVTPAAQTKPIEPEKPSKPWEQDPYLEKP